MNLNLNLNILNKRMDSNLFVTTKQCNLVDLFVHHYLIQIVAKARLVKGRVDDRKVANRQFGS